MRLSARALWLCALVLPSCQKSNGTRVLLTISMTDPITAYDLYVKQAGAVDHLLHSDWSPLDRTDLATRPLKIGLTLPADGDYKIGLVASIGEPVGHHADLGAGGRQFYWAEMVHASGDSTVSGTLTEVFAGDDFDGDGIPAEPWRESNAPNLDATLVDCNDMQEKIFPFADEICSDGIDQDCDGSDANCDADGDGDPDPTDCAPNDPTVHHPSPADPYPESPNCCGRNLGLSGGQATMDMTGMLVNGVMLCHPGTCGDGIDQDCDGRDVACVADHDCDGFPAMMDQPACGAKANDPPGDDCDDCNAAINPSARDICDGIDNNCNQAIDEDCVSCDLDGDGYQRDDAANGCPDGNNMGKALDCDDYDAGAFPGSTATPSKVPILGAQTCNGVEGPSTTVCALRGVCRNKDATGMAQDADCVNGAHTGCPTVGCDADGDGFPANLANCGAGPFDCNDDPTPDPMNHNLPKGAAFFPGAPAPCGETSPHNCSALATCGTDADGDGWDAMNDCDDANPNVHPWALELCNGVDDDCDGLIDEGNPDANGMPLGVVACNDDSRGDCGLPAGMGRCGCSAASVATLKFGTTRMACPAETAAVDTAAGSAVRCYGAAQPGNELCDGKDQDCDGVVDDNLLDCPGMPPAATCCKSIPPACSMLNDAMNCGMCGMTCNLANAVAACVAQACAVATCNAGYSDCDKSNSDGCEINTAGDTQNCGMCGNKCGSPPNTSSINCTAGNCTVGGCNGTHADCNGSFSDGCEIDTNNNTNHCGNCTTNCTVANGTPACSSGACGIASCDSSHGDCSGGYGDGCETDITSDPNHCGNCSTVCSVNHGTAACATKMCKIGSCSAGWSDCSGGYGDGCETNTGGSDINNCGSCGFNCNASGKHYGDSCSSGGCKCNGGSACDGNQYWCAGSSGCLLSTGQPCQHSYDCYSNWCHQGNCHS